MALGISLLVAWFEAFFIALKGILVLSLLFCGAIFVLVGYSEMKARREFEIATQTDAASSGDESQAREKQDNAAP